MTSEEIIHQENVKAASEGYEQSLRRYLNALADGEDVAALRFRLRIQLKIINQLEAGIV